MKTRTFTATYDTRFVAVARPGAVTLFELPHTQIVDLTPHGVREKIESTTLADCEPVTIKGAAAKRLVADLDEVEGYHEEDGAEFNAVRYWILDHAYREALRA